MGKHPTEGEDHGVTDHALGHRAIATVVVDGNVVMLNGDVLTLDLRTIQAKARRRAREIAAALRPAHSRTR
jgi:hypothetical protein